MIIKTEDTPYIRFELSNGILYAQYKPGVVITLELAKELLAKRLAFTEHKEYPMLISDMGIVSVEREAWALLSSEEGTHNITAGAMLLNTTYSRILGNFFFKLAAPKIPAKIFSNKERALEWLEQYKKEDL
jgi:hypothetical protein